MRGLAIALLPPAGIVAAAILWATISLEPTEHCRAVAHDAVACEVRGTGLKQAGLVAIAVVPSLLAYALYEFSAERTRRAR